MIAPEILLQYLIINNGERVHALSGSSKLQVCYKSVFVLALVKIFKILCKGTMLSQFSLSYPILSTVLTELDHRPIQSISRNVLLFVVVASHETLNHMDWRLLVEEHTAKIAKLVGE